MHPMKCDRVRTIEIVPARVFIREQKIERVACRCPEGTIKRAAPTGIIKPGSYASASLLAHVGVSKSLDGLLVYRQQQILARYGLTLPQSTIEDYFRYACEECEPIAKAIWTECVNSDYMRVDDTSTLVLQNLLHKAPKRGRTWVALASCDGKQAVLQAFLEIFAGLEAKHVCGRHPGGRRQIFCEETATLATSTTFPRMRGSFLRGAWTMRGRSFIRRRRPDASCPKPSCTT